MTPDQKAELLDSFEAFALLMELDGKGTDAVWFRTITPGLADSFETVDRQCPGFIEIVLSQYREDLWGEPNGGSTNSATT